MKCAKFYPLISLFVIIMLPAIGKPQNYLPTLKKLKTFANIVDGKERISNFNFTPLISAHDSETVSLFLNDPTNTQYEKNFKDLMKTEYTIGKTGTKAFLSGQASGAISLPFQSNLIYAMTDFIIGRAKAEFALSYLQGFKKFLDDNAIARRLFPHTLNLFSLAENNIERLFPIGNVLKATLTADFESLPESLSVVALSNNPDAKAAVTIAFKLVDEIESGRTPGDIYENLIQEVPLKNSSFSNFWITLNAGLKFGEVYYFEKEDLEDVMDLLNEKKFLTTKKLFVFWIFAEAKADTNFYISLFGSLDSLHQKIDVLFPKFNALSSLLERATQLGQELKNNSEVSKSGVEKFTDPYTKYINALFEVLEFSNQLICSKDPCSDTTKLMKKIRVVKEFYNSIRSKKYGAALASALPLINDLTGNDISQATLFKYLNFAASIADAEDSEQMKKAIEAAAMPIGSYRAKESNNLITLNSYAGGGLGFENSTKFEKKKYAVQGGTWVPIGLEANIDDLGILFTLIDLGAVANYRLGHVFKDTAKVKTEPEIGFHQILSPGVFFRFGHLAGSLALGTGIQLSPKLRKVTDAGATQSQLTTIRISLFVALDIPLFNLAKL